jgi:hypothetical protein
MGQVIVSTVAVGALSLGGAGLAAAASPAAPAVSVTAPGTAKLSAFNCSNAGRALTRIDKAEARIAAGLPRLQAAENKAKAAGHSRRAARIHQAITRLEGSKVKNRLARRAAAIEAKCGVSAPAPTTSAGA